VENQILCILLMSSLLYIAWDKVCKEYEQEPSEDNHSKYRHVCVCRYSDLSVFSLHVCIKAHAFVCVCVEHKRNLANNNDCGY
jgi:hypothetical protein